MYSQFCGAAEKAAEFLGDVLHRRPPLAKRLDEIRANPEAKGQSLQSLLIMPIQRLPRYLMTLKVWRLPSCWQRSEVWLRIRAGDGAERRSAFEAFVERGTQITIAPFKIYTD